MYVSLNHLSNEVSVSLALEGITVKRNFDGQKQLKIS